MCGSSTSSSSGGGESKRNKKVVSITEKGFQSPGTSGKDINTGGETFRRAVSKGSQNFTKGAAQLTGALSGIPLLGDFLSSKVPSTIETDSSGKRKQAFGEIKSSFDDSTSRQEAGEKQTALTAAAAATKTATATAKKADDKAKAASIKKRGGKRTNTVLAGAKIAEEKLKTKLGQ